MLKNIIFDFGNVIMNYNPDEILNHYELTPQEHDLLRKTIFESKEWSEIDAGKIDEKEAMEIFIGRVPVELKNKVRQIMLTWPQNVDFYESVFHFINELREDGYKNKIYIEDWDNLSLAGRGCAGCNTQCMKVVMDDAKGKGYVPKVKIRTTDDQLSISMAREDIASAFVSRAAAIANLSNDV